VQPLGNAKYQGHAWCHLNKNVFENNDNFALLDTEEKVEAHSAINIGGSVIAKLDADEDIHKMGFQFLQVAKVGMHWAMYAGCEPSLGSILLDSADADVFDEAETYMLDTGWFVFPFIADRMHQTQDKGNGRFLVTNDMDDHPQMKVPLVQVNPLTNQPNL
jgi:hypothetical protein